MAMSERVRQAVQKIVHECQSRNPYEICRQKHISILHMPMGTNPKSGKGICFCNRRCVTIVLNSDLPEEVLYIVLLHEIGHAILHASIPGVKPFTDDEINLENSNIHEREANLFAAELALADEDILDAMRDEMTFFPMAAYLGVPAELLEFKLNMMQQDGYAFNLPNISRSDFLKRDISRPYQV